ncbi:MAG: amidohydrolase family protein [Eubacteriales bacterium]|jgi:predicted TIM-barrel fold metal-dependent hydrolase
MNRCFIIDGHTHMYDDKIAKNVIDTFTEFHKMHPKESLGKGTLQDVLHNMEQYSIDYTVLANFAPAKSIIKTNEWTLSAAKQHRGLIPLISVHPEMPIDFIEQYIDRGAKGIKMHTGIQGFEPNDERLKPVYEYCANCKIPVTFHCGETSKVHVNDFAAVDHILPVLEAYPDVPFILTHLAAGNPYDVYRIADSFPNTYFDTSITMTGEHCIDRIHDDFWENDTNVVDAFRTVGCERITFGSDYPFGNPGSDIRRILSLSLTEKEKQMILGMNTMLLYRLDMDVEK